MDKDHRMDSPDNESLRSIEQLGDHSELTTIYPHAKNEFDGDLLSSEAREEKRDKEQQRINLTIRKWFVVIGLLIPVPFILGEVLFTIVVTYVSVTNVALLLIPVVIAVLFWLIVSVKAIKRVYAIFYEHSIKATPFVATLLVLLLMSLQAHYMLILPLYTDSILLNSLFTSGVVLMTSIVLSGLLLLIWTSSRISATLKFGCVGIIVLVILIITTIVNFL